jgi:hypothetical protein
MVWIRSLKIVRRCRCRDSTGYGWCCLSVSTPWENHGWDPAQPNRNSKMLAEKPRRRDGRSAAKPQPKTSLATDDTDRTDSGATKSLRTKSWELFRSMILSSMILSLGLKVRIRCRFRRPRRPSAKGLQTCRSPCHIGVAAPVPGVLRRSLCPQTHSSFPAAHQAYLPHSDYSVYMPVRTPYPVSV